MHSWFTEFLSCNCNIKKKNQNVTVPVAPNVPAKKVPESIQPRMWPNRNLAELYHATQSETFPWPHCKYFINVILRGSHHLSEKLLSECRIEKMAEKIMSETAKYNIRIISSEIIDR